MPGQSHGVARHNFRLLRRPLPNLFFVNSATSEGSNTIVMPAGLTAKMRALMIDCAENSTTAIPTLVTPAGWLPANSFTGIVLASFGVRIALSYRDLDGTESGTTITGMDCATTNGGKVVQVFGGNGVFGVPTSVAGNAGDAPLTGTTITAGTPSGIAIACSGKFVGTRGLTMSPAAVGTQTTATVMAAGYIAYISAALNNAVSVPADLAGGLISAWQPYT